MITIPRVRALMVALIIVANCLSADAWAQLATIRGVVVDKESGTLLVDATITLDNMNGQVIQTTSGDQGLFSMGRLGPGRYKLTVSYVGFVPWADTLHVTMGADRFQRVEMEPAATAIAEIVVEEIRTDADRYVAGLESIQPGDLVRIPMPDVTYDLAGYLQSIPGFVSTGDRGGQLFVRGGTPTQNLVLLDGIPIYQPFHIVGFYSAVPVDVISYADVYAGGFGAQYGGRISSVIDITTRNPSDQRIRAAGSIAPFLTGLRLEMPLAEKDVAIMLSLRESLIERVAPDLLGKELPFRFGDFLGKLYANLSPTSSVSITALRTHDEGNILAEKNIESLNANRSTWKNQAYGLRYLFLPPDYPAMFEFAAHYTRMESAFRLTPEEFRTSTAQNISGKMRYHYLLGDSQIHFGIFGSLSEFRYRLNPALYSEYAAVSSGGGYIDTRYLLFDHLRIEPGVRFESFSHGVSMSLGPRLRVILLPEGRRSRHQLSAAWGLYHQQIVGLSNEQDVSEVFTIWSASPQNVAVPRAEHLIAGYRGRLFPGFELSIEAYKKWLDHLAFPVFPEAVDGETSFSKVSGAAQGVDFKIDLDIRSLYVSVSYSLSSVRYRREEDDQRTILIPGIESSLTDDVLEFAPPHDRKHQINAMVHYEMGSNRFSIRWQLGSGLPFTQVNGYYNHIDPANLTNPEAVGNPGELYVSRSRLYGERLPAYHRLDVSYERLFTFNAVQATIQLGVINAYDRANIFSYNIFTGDRVDQFPLIPSVGIKIETR